MMYGLDSLRPVAVVDEGTVTCHVAGCTTVVARQRRRFAADEQFLCPEHGIYLSPSTFQYRDAWENLLWRDEVDRELFGQILRVKRTAARLGRERDEDALTWNVVRAFDRAGRLGALAAALLGGGHEVPGEPEVVYWGAGLPGGRWPLLEKAQRQFGEVPERGTEPDVAIWWPGERLIFVEAKFCSADETRPTGSAVNGEQRRSYETPEHFREAFAGTYDEMVGGGLYQLLRLWLLGTWLAQDQGAEFHLVNLVCESRERDIEPRFQPHCRKRAGWHFHRATWEGIWDRLPESGLPDSARETLDRYFLQKSAGYDRNGRLQRAFTEPESRRLLWFAGRDAWRKVWGRPRTIQSLIFRILRGSNDARRDFHHQAASECDLDYDVARNIVEAFLASGWRPPEGVAVSMEGAERRGKLRQREAAMGEAGRRR